MRMGPRAHLSNQGLNAAYGPSGWNGICPTRWRHPSRKMASAMASSTDQRGNVNAGAFGSLRVAPIHSPSIHRNCQLHITKAPVSLNGTGSGTMALMPS